MKFLLIDSNETIFDPIVRLPQNAEISLLNTCPYIITMYIEGEENETQLLLFPPLENDLVKHFIPLDVKSIKKILLKCFNSFGAPVAFIKQSFIIQEKKYYPCTMVGG